MKYIQTAFLILLMAVFTGCSKKSGGGGDPAPTPVTPTNLTLTATVSADKNGNVTFTASATNAATYDFDFGNGVYQTVASGVVTYRYPAAGSYTVSVIAKSKTGQTITKSVDVTVTITSSVVWAEEFDTPGAPNPAVWGYDLGNGDSGWGNNELEYYTNRAENVIVSNGTLKIMAKKENYSGYTFTSARLLSKGKFSFKYGKIEVRAKIPAGVGTWPAIWAMGDNFSTVGWPACGEMDIMEHRGSELNKIFGTFHYPGNFGGNGKSGSTMIANATTEFHRYALDWSPTAIKMLVDDVVFYTLPNNSSLPFNQNFFVILNVAIGGNFAGAVDPALTGATMEVDYVRVTQ
jgi:beta-glucanase (GH16 family)